MRRRFAFTTAVNGVGMIIGFAASMVLTPLVLHSLGEETYGLWVLITSFSIASGYLSILDFGIQSSVVKFVAEHSARDEQGGLNQVVSASLYLFVGLSVVGAIALALFGHFFLTSVFRIPPHLVPIMRLLLDLLAIQTLFEFPGLALSAVIDGLQRYDIQRAAQIVYVLVYSVAIYVLVTAGFGVLAIGVTSLALALVRTAYFALTVGRLMPRLRFTRRFDRRVLSRVARFSGKVFLIRMNALVYYAMDKTLIAAMLSSTLLTLYDVASKLRNVALAPLSLITSQIVPIAARREGLGDEAGLRRLFLTGTKYQLALALPGAVAVYILADPFIRLWVGPSYAQAVPLAQLFVVYVVLDAAVSVGYNVMIGMGAVGSLVLIQVFTTTGLNLLVSVILTPRIGVAGVIWGTVVGTAVSVVPYVLLYTRRLHLSVGGLLRASVLPPVVAAAVLATVLWAGTRLVVPRSFAILAIEASVGAAIYALSFFAFATSRGELRSLIRLILPQVARSRTE